MLLLRGAEVFSPEPLGVRDILVAGPRIVGVAAEITPPTGVEIEILDVHGMRVIPGLIDGHVHITGGGGEGGPATRTPELRMSWLIEAGVTTVVGCLGTDGFTRSVESVLMKVKSLRAEGVSAYMMTGAYQVPTPTLLGDVGRDLAMIDEVIGVGEIAVADHRSSCPTMEELRRLAEHARVGGMLGGKAGIVNLHMGDETDPFRLVRAVLEHSMLKARQFWPTHCNRNPYIFEDAHTWGREGLVDITASSYPYYPDEEIKPSRAVRELVSSGVPLDHVTMTSDACGSLPEFDAQGRLVKLHTARPMALLTEMLDMARNEAMPFYEGLSVVTSNVADILGLSRKGRLCTGHDADLVVMDTTGTLVHVIAMGAMCMRDGRIVKKGTFED